MARIYYCPEHGRVTEEDYENSSQYRYCPHCVAWYHRIHKFKAKRIYES